MRPAEQISDEDRTLVQSVARAIISDRRGALADQINRRGFVERRVSRAKQIDRRSFIQKRVAPLVPTRLYRPELPAAPAAASASPPLRCRETSCSSTTGSAASRPTGASTSSRLLKRTLTPAPWVNVLANPHFGTIISESGMAYTWSENAHQFRLTPWADDPVSDASGEAFYLRDEESGHFWTPTPLPCRGATPYVSRHGFGYSSFEHAEDGISSELTVYVALDAAVKFSVLKVRNESGQARRLSTTGYVEWVLGELRSKIDHARHDRDRSGERRALCAQCL